MINSDHGLIFLIVWDILGSWHPGVTFLPKEKSEEQAIAEHGGPLHLPAGSGAAAWNEIL